MAHEVRSTPTGEIRFITDGGRPRIDARAILFDSWSVDLGGFRERMMPGSVNLDADLVALFDHDTSMVLGRTSANTMEVREDSIGVAFTAYPPETTWAQDLRVSMERGDIRGCSYRMMVEDDFWYVQDDQVCRDIIKANISELTVTSMPAYPETTAEARSHAQALAKQAPGEARVGRVLSDANEQVLKTALVQIEAASDAIESVISSVDPSFNEDDLIQEDPSMEEKPAGPDAGRTPGAEYLAPPTDSATGSMDGAFNESQRSSVGATETPTPETHTYVPGFGFIPTRKEN